MINKFISGLSPKEKKILFAAALFALVALFDRLLVGPSLGRLHDIDDSIVKEVDSIQQNIRFLAHRDKIIKEAAVFKDFFSKDVKTEEEVIAGFLRKIETIASESQVETSKITPAGQDYQKDHLKYYVSLDCSGKFENITNFIYAVNNSRELLKVEKINLLGNTRDAEKVQANLTISKMIIGADPSVDPKTLVKVKEPDAPARSENPQQK